MNPTESGRPRLAGPARSYAGRNQGGLARNRNPATNPPARRQLQAQRISDTNQHQVG